MAGFTYSTLTTAIQNYTEVGTSVLSSTITDQFIDNSELRIGAMNRIIKKHPNIRGYSRAQTERFMDEYGKVSSSKAKTKKEYKGKK